MISQRIRLRATKTSARRAAGLRVLVVVALAVAFALPSVAQERPATAKEQLEFGVQMAQRQLWSEALFRFRQAQKLEPENPRIFNNLAVAHEALGMFEEALSLYRQGLEIAPQDKGLRNNYARFVDFYQRFKPDDEEPASDTEGAEDSADEQPPTAGSPEESSMDSLRLSQARGPFGIEPWRREAAQMGDRR